MRRTRLFVPLLVLLLPLAACGETEGDSVSTSPDPLDGRTFVSTSVTGRDLVAGSTVTLGFDGGQVSVNAGCNQLSGSGRVSDGRLMLTGMGGTEMGCEPALMDQDGWIADLLTTGVDATLEGDDLTLAGGDVVLALRDQEAIRADDPIALEGTTWVLESIIDGAGADGTVSSVIEGPRGPATIVLEGDRLSVSTGCNSGRAIVTASDTSWEVTSLALTKMACKDGMEAERALSALLDGTVTVTQEYDALTLTGADGGGLQFRAQQ